MWDVRLDKPSDGPKYAAGLLTLMMMLSVIATLAISPVSSPKEFELQENPSEISMAEARTATGWSQFGDSSNPANFGDLAVSESNGDVYATGMMSASSALSFGTQTASSSATVQPWFAKSDASGNWQWANSAPVSGGQYAEANIGGIALSSSGDMYVTGVFYDNITFGSTNLRSTGYYDCFIAKANSAGQWQWAQALHGNGDYDGTIVTTLDVVWGTAIDVDSSGNVIIGGFFIGNTDVGIATDSGGASGDDAEIFVAKYSGSGTLQWTSDARGAGFQEVTSVSFDVNNDAWISTSFDGNMAFGSYSVTGTTGNSEGAFAKMSSSGSWASATPINGGGDVIITAITENGGSNLLMSGHLTSDASFGTTLIASAGGETFGWISSYNITSGNWNWANGLGGSSYDIISDIAAAPGGNSGIVAMSSASSFSVASDSFSPQGFNDSIVAVFDANTGNWLRGVFAGSTANDWPQSMGVSSAGQVVVGGLFADTIDFSSTGGSSHTSSSDFAPYIWAINGILADDSDGDGVSDEEDNCPSDANPGQEDHDLDGEGDECDYDDDNDTILDNSGDDCPLGEVDWVSNSDDMDKDSSTDWDLDGCKDDVEDDDIDNDNVANDMDDCIRSQWDHLVLLKPTWVSNASNDIDGDGCRDADEDDDDDGDGVVDGFDSCPSVPGTSTLGNHLGCPDDDGDGWSNMTDDCPFVNGTSSNGTLNGCQDTDGDGWADSEDALMYEPTQWIDSDDDGFGDNQDGFRADECPNDKGYSMEDRWGCPDSDGDGYSDPDDFWTTTDGADAFYNLSTQWTDSDDDGYGDNYENQSWLDTRPTSWPGGYEYLAEFQDSCPTIEGTSYKDEYYGCRDTDGDGYADDIDAFPFTAEEWVDSDNDEIGDNGDACPIGTAKDNSTIDRIGCLDSDGDGYSDPDGITWKASDGADAFRTDATQWSDKDMDTFGDNPNGTEPDACPDEHGTSTKIGWLGCPPDVVAAAEAAEQEANEADGLFGSGGASDGGSMLYIVIGVVAVVIITALLLLLFSRRGNDDEDKAWADDGGYAADAYSQAYGQQAAGYAQPGAQPEIVQQPERMPAQTQASVLMPTQPVQQAEPTYDMVGQMRSDGNEWMEHPEGGGMWYMRDATSRQWVRKI